MSETDVEVENPLYDAWLELVDPNLGMGGDYRGMRELLTNLDAGRPAPEGFRSPFDARRGLVSTFAWAIPSPDAIQTVAGYSPLVEVGAGTGYWAHLLEKAGADVVAYDLCPSDRDVPVRPLNAPPISYFEVRPARSDEAAARHPDRTLLLVWPPYADSMAHDALAAYAGGGGRRVVYVGEGEGGCTADDEFHELLGKGWAEVAQFAIPRWPGIRDYGWVYER